MRLHDATPFACWMIPSMTASATRPLAHCMQGQASLVELEEPFTRPVTIPMHAQASLGELDVADRSSYTVSPPRIWGYALPRLARRIAVGRASLLLERSAAYGLMLSAELSDASAQGFPAEPGNFPSQARCFTSRLAWTHCV